MPIHPVADTAAKNAALAAASKPLDAYTATMIAEGVEEASEERQLGAWQYLVDTGLAWSLQGSFGRTAKALIERGLIHAKEEA